MPMYMNKALLNENCLSKRNKCEMDCGSDGMCNFTQQNKKSATMFQGSYVA